MPEPSPTPKPPSADPSWSFVGDELDLLRYLRALRRRRWTIGLVTLTLAVAAGLLSASATPTYEATATVLLQRSTPDAVEGMAPAMDPEVQGRIELLLFTSEQVTDRAEAQLGREVQVSATLGDDAVSLDVSARSDDPDLAAAAANTFAETYLDLRLETTLAEYEATAEVVRQQLDRLDADIDLAGLSEDRDALLTQRAVFQQRLDALTVGADLAESDGPVIVQSAEVPTVPVSPRPVRDIGVGVLVGLLVGMAVALVQDRMDDSVRTREDLAAIPGAANVLGLVPQARGWTSVDEARVVTREHPSSAVAESYRSLRTAVQFAAFDHPIRTLQMTSPRARDGKSTTSTNLGVVLARAGQRTVLVDFDLRRPRLHQFFELGNDRGLTSVLLGEATVDEALQRVPGETDLFVLTSGPCPPYPSSLLASDRPRAVIDQLRATGAMIIIDSPPVLPVADALQLSHLTDALILVAKAGTTRRREIAGALDRIHQVGAPLIGTVLNAVRAEDDDLDDGYGYGYGSESAPRSPVIDLDR